MKNPGKMTVGSKHHKAMVEYAQALAEEFDIASIPALGVLLKLHDCIGKAADSEEGMANLIISNKVDGAKA